MPNLGRLNLRRICGFGINPGYQGVDVVDAACNCGSFLIYQLHFRFVCLLGMSYPYRLSTNVILELDQSGAHCLKLFSQCCCGLLTSGVNRPKFDLLDFNVQGIFRIDDCLQFSCWLFNRAPDLVSLGF
ncbi:MAG: hypothetical protein J4N97_09805 [Chloroflexi bacterium]|nr:hypothetical protein [Chloroflexota bacterium]